MTTLNTRDYVATASTRGCRKACWLTFAAASMFTITGMLTSVTFAATEGGHFEVTVTNLTRGQQFTPFLVTSHKKGVSLFELGKPPIPEFVPLAEYGKTDPLSALLRGMPEVEDVQVNSAFLGPGESATVTVTTHGSFDYVSVAAMLIPTDDGFFAINEVLGPKRDEELTLYSPTYDAGSKKNDELCSSIPGPFFAECGGPGGGGVVGGGEGYVHIHAGIHGVGNFAPSNRDWRNPVARVTIRRVD
jgi:Spondin_N